MFDRQLVTDDRTLNRKRLLETAEAYLQLKQERLSALANMTALIDAFFDDVNWVGVYLRRADALVLGPFQGFPACTDIPLGKGVCGTSAREGKTLVVDDVETFEGHIVCDRVSKSEIVVPLLKDGRVVAVLDLDSPVAGRFDEDDRKALEALAGMMVDKLW